MSRWVWPTMMSRAVRTSRTGSLIWLKNVTSKKNREIFQVFFSQLSTEVFTQKQLYCRITGVLFYACKSNKALIDCHIPFYFTEGKWKVKLLHSQLVLNYMFKYSMLIFIHKFNYIIKDTVKQLAFRDAPTGIQKFIVLCCHMEFLFWFITRENSERKGRVHS